MAALAYIQQVFSYNHTVFCKHAHMSHQWRLCHRGLSVCGAFERDELMDERISSLEVGSGLDPDWVGIVC